MVGGGVVKEGELTGWSMFASPEEAMRAGAFTLSQDFELMRKMIPVWISQYLELIDTKTTNWDSDRIALMDVLLMQMAITELVHFKEIPVKVTINEYIEISKDYSTPKSNSFINGILDKILADLKKNKQVLKVGRGLLN
jgi:N utilization substance protein B